MRRLLYVPASGRGWEEEAESCAGRSRLVERGEEDAAGRGRAAAANVAHGWRRPAAFRSATAAAHAPCVADNKLMRCIVTAEGHQSNRCLVRRDAGASSPGVECDKHVRAMRAGQWASARPCKSKCGDEPRGAKPAAAAACPGRTVLVVVLTRVTPHHSCTGLVARSHVLVALLRRASAVMVLSAPLLPVRPSVDIATISRNPADYTRHRSGDITARPSFAQPFSPPLRSAARVHASSQRRQVRATVRQALPVLARRTQGRRVQPEPRAA